MPTPSPQDYALLSAAAYAINGTGNFSGLPPGWTPLVATDGELLVEQDPEGMVAQAFVNKSTIGSLPLGPVLVSLPQTALHAQTELVDGPLIDVQIAGNNLRIPPMLLSVT